MLETRVLTGLQEKMLDPELVSAFVEEYHREYASRARELTRERAKLELQLKTADSKLKRLVEAIADGADEFVEIKDMLREAKAQRDHLRSELADLDALPAIALHPTIADDYRRQVHELNRTLSRDPESRMETLPILRALIDRIIVVPAAKGRGVDLSVEGRLAAILALATGAPMPADEEITVTGERARGIEPPS